MPLGATCWLEEYKALRAELLLHMEQKWKSEVYCLTGSAVIFSASLAYEAWALSLVVWVLCLYFGAEHRNHASTVIMIGCYIRLAIEKGAPALTWHEVLGELDDQRTSRLQFRLTRLCLPHVAMSTTSIGVATILFILKELKGDSLATWCLEAPSILLLVFPTLVFLNLLFFVFCFGHNGVAARRKWDDRFTKLLQEKRVAHMGTNS